MTKRRTHLASKHASEAPPKRPNGSRRDALLVENSERALQDGPQLVDDDSKEGNFRAPNTNVPAYQAKLLEMAQSNMQFAFEFVQRLATIRSPVEFPGVMSELTSKRIAIFWKHFGRVDFSPTQATNTSSRLIAADYRNTTT